MTPSYVLPLKRDDMNHSYTAAQAGEEYAGWLNQLLADDSISDIMINRYNHIFIEREGQLQELPFQFASPEAVTEFAHYIIQQCGKSHVAEMTPVVDGILPDGSRVAVVLPPVAVDGPSISIRKFARTPWTLDAMVKLNLLTPHLAVFLKAAAKRRLNILIAGNTSSGKTTLLNALSAHIGENERVVTIEDTAELRLQQKNVVRMEIQVENLPRGYVRATARDLLKSSLRMRPDRIIMGEVRGAEAFDLLQAINTGHEGSMATIHANSPRQAATRLEHMVSMANLELSPKLIRQQLSAALDIVVQVLRDETGRRRITHVTEVVGMEGDTLLVQDLFVCRGITRDGRTSQSIVQATSRTPKVQAALQDAALSQ